MAIEAEVDIEAEVEPGEGGELEATGEPEVDVEPDVTMILGIHSNKKHIFMYNWHNVCNHTVTPLPLLCLLYSDECDDALKWKDSDEAVHVECFTDSLVVLWGQYYSVYMDNFFTSIPLFRSLWQTTFMPLEQCGGLGRDFQKIFLRSLNEACLLEEIA